MTHVKKFQHKVLNHASRITVAFALVTSAAALTSCDGDDDEDKGFPSVQGKWTGSKTELVIRVEGVDDPFTETDQAFQGQVEFKSNGVAVYSEDGDTEEGTWSQNGDKLTLTIPDDSEELDMSGVYTIKDISSSNLKIYIEKETVLTDPDSGQDFDANIKATLYFNKN
jgi:hypothetical protein